MADVIKTVGIDANDLKSLFSDLKKDIKKTAEVDVVVKQSTTGGDQVRKDLDKTEKKIQEVNAKDVKIMQMQKAEKFLTNSAFNKQGKPHQEMIKLMSLFRPGEDLLDTLDDAVSDYKLGKKNGLSEDKLLPLKQQIVTTFQAYKTLAGSDFNIEEIQDIIPDFSTVLEEVKNGVRTYAQAINNVFYSMNEILKEKGVQGLENFIQNLFNNVDDGADIVSQIIPDTYKGTSPWSWIKEWDLPLRYYGKDAWAKKKQEENVFQYNNQVKSLKLNKSNKNATLTNLALPQLKQNNLYEYAQQLKNTAAYAVNEIQEERAILYKDYERVGEEIIGTGGHVNPGAAIKKYNPDTLVHTHQFDTKFDNLRFSFDDIQMMIASKVKEMILLCGDEMLTLDISSIPKQNLSDFFTNIRGAYNAVAASYGAEIIQQADGSIITNTDKLPPEIQNSIAQMYNRMLTQYANQFGGNLYIEKLNTEDQSWDDVFDARQNLITPEAFQQTKKYLDALANPDFQTAVALLKELQKKDGFISSAQNNEDSNQNSSPVAIKTRQPNKIKFESLTKDEFETFVHQMSFEDEDEVTFDWKEIEKLYDIPVTKTAKSRKKKIQDALIRISDQQEVAFNEAFEAYNKQDEAEFLKKAQTYNRFRRIGYHYASELAGQPEKDTPKKKKQEAKARQENAEAINAENDAIERQKISKEEAEKTIRERYDTKMVDQRKVQQKTNVKETGDIVSDIGLYEKKLQELQDLQQAQFRFATDAYNKSVENGKNPESNTDWQAYIQSAHEYEAAIQIVNDKLTELREKQSQIDQQNQEAPSSTPQQESVQNTAEAVQEEAEAHQENASAIEAENQAKNETPPQTSPVDNAESIREEAEAHENNAEAIREENAARQDRDETPLEMSLDFDEYTQDDVRNIIAQQKFDEPDVDEILTDHGYIPHTDDTPDQKVAKAMAAAEEFIKRKKDNENEILAAATDLYNEIFESGEDPLQDARFLKQASAYQYYQRGEELVNEEIDRIQQDAKDERERQEKLAREAAEKAEEERQAQLRAQQEEAEKERLRLAALERSKDIVLDEESPSIDREHALLTQNKAAEEANQQMKLTTAETASSMEEVTAATERTAEAAQQAAEAIHQTNDARNEAIAASQQYTDVLNIEAEAAQALANSINAGVEAAQKDYALKQKNIDQQQEQGQTQKEESKNKKEQEREETQKPPRTSSKQSEVQSKSDKAYNKLDRLIEKRFNAQRDLITEKDRKKAAGLRDDIQGYDDEIAKIHELINANQELANAKREESATKSQEKFDKRLNDYTTEIEAAKQEEAAIKRIDKLKKKINDTKIFSAEEQLKNNKVLPDRVEEFTASLKNVRAEYDAVTKAMENYGNLTEAELVELENRAEALRTKLKEGLIPDNALKADTDQINNVIRSIVEFQKANNLDRGNRDTVSGWLETLKTGKTSGNITVKQLEKIISAFREMRTAVADSSQSGQSFTAMVGERVKSLGAYLSTFVGFYEIMGQVREGLTIIKDLDDALTEMSKVSDEPLSRLKAFQTESYNIAEAAGTTGMVIQQSTADFMRLGQSLDEAQKSAKNASTLLNVSEFSDISEATDALIAMSAAYEELPQEDILDKLNNIGNNFSISTEGLATALQNSAATLRTAGNDIDESIALITAGNQIVQDPNKVGNAFRTVALRITGTKEAKDQLAALGEDVDDFVVQTEAKSRQIIKDYTAVAKNGFKGVDILDENGNFRSTYQILQDIADVYEEIVETDKKYGTNRSQGLLETLAGKNRANVIASVLQSPSVLRNVYESSQNSFGSAEEELEKWKDSITGHLATIQNKWQQAWTTVGNRDQINFFIDLGSAVLDVVNKFGMLETVVPTIALLYGTVLRAGKENMGVMQFLQAAFKGLGKEVGATTKVVGESFDDAADGIVELTKVTGGLGITWGTLIGIAAALGATMYLGYKHSQAYSDSTEALIRRNKALIKQNQEKTQSLQNELKENQNNATSLQELLTRYQEATVGSEEYYHIRQQIADQFPQLIVGYDGERGAIIDTTEAIQDQVTEYNNLAEASKNALRVQAEENIKRGIEGDTGANWFEKLFLGKSDNSTTQDLRNKAKELQDELTLVQSGGMSARMYDVSDPNTGAITEKGLTREEAIAAITKELGDVTEQLGDQQQYFRENYALVIDDLDASNEPLVKAVSNLEKLASQTDTTLGEFLQYYDILKETDFSEKGNIGEQLQSLFNPNFDKITAKDYQRSLRKTLADVMQSLHIRQDEFNNWFDLLGLDDSVDSFNSQMMSIINNVDYQKTAKQFGLNWANTVKNLSASDILSFNADDFFSTTFVNDFKERNADLAKNMADATALNLSAINLQDEQLIQNAKELSDAYDQAMSEIEARGIDLTKSIYGNIDLNNRQLLNGNETVLGSWGNYEGLDIAFSPILQTPNGPVLLDDDAIADYFYGLFEHLGDNWTTEDLLAIDADTEKSWTTLHGLIADVGETAEATAENMHWVEELKFVKNELNAVGGEGVLAFKQFADDAIAQGIVETYSEAIELATRFNLIVDDTAEGLQQSFEAWKTDTKANIESIAQAETALNTIISEQLKTGHVSQDNASALITANPEYQTALEYTARGLQLNVAQARHLRDAERQLQRQDLTAKYTELNDQFTSNEAELNNLIEVYGDLTDKESEDAKQKLEQISSLLMAQEAIKGQVSALQELQAQYGATASAYAEWQAGLSSGNYSDQYDTITGWKDTYKQLHEQGRYGNDDYENFTRMFYGNVDFGIKGASKKYEPISGFIDKYFTEDDQGPIKMYQAMKDAVQKEIEKDPDGGFSGWITDDGNLNVKNLDQLSMLMTDYFKDSMGEDFIFTPELMEIFSKAFTEFGIGDFLKADEEQQTVEGLTKSIAEMEDYLDGLGENDKPIEERSAKWQLWNEILQDTKLQLLSLQAAEAKYKSPEEINNLVDTVNQGLEGQGSETKVEVPVIVTNADEANSTINSLIEARNELTKVDEKTGEIIPIEGMGDAYAAINELIAYYTGQKQIFEQPWIMNVDTSNIQDSGLAEFVKKVQEYQTTLNQLKESDQANGLDSTKSQTLRDNLETIHQELVEMDKESGHEYTAQLGFNLNAEDLPAEIQKIFGLGDTTATETENEIAINFNVDQPNEQITALENSLADIAKEKVEITFALRDEYGNPISATDVGLSSTSGASGVAPLTEDQKDRQQNKINSIMEERINPGSVGTSSEDYNIRVKPNTIQQSWELTKERFQSFAKKVQEIWGVLKSTEVKDTPKTREEMEATRGLTKPTLNPQPNAWEEFTSTVKRRFASLFNPSNNKSEAEPIEQEVVAKAEEGTGAKAAEDIQNEVDNQEPVKAPVEVEVAPSSSTTPEKSVISEEEIQTAMSQASEADAYITKFKKWNETGNVNALDVMKAMEQMAALAKAVEWLQQNAPERLSEGYVEDINSSSLSPLTFSGTGMSKPTNYAPPQVRSEETLNELQGQISALEKEKEELNSSITQLTNETIHYATTGESEKLEEADTQLTEKRERLQEVKKEIETLTNELNNPTGKAEAVESQNAEQGKKPGFLQRIIDGILGVETTYAATSDEINNNPIEPDMDISHVEQGTDQITGEYVPNVVNSFDEVTNTPIEANTTEAEKNLDTMQQHAEELFKTMSQPIQLSTMNKPSQPSSPQPASSSSSSGDDGTKSAGAFASAIDSVQKKMVTFKSGIQDFKDSIKEAFSGLSSSDGMELDVGPLTEDLSNVASEFGNLKTNADSASDSVSSFGSTSANSLSEVSGAIEDTTGKSNTLGESVENTSKKTFGNFGSPNTIQAVQSVINKVNEVGPAVDSASNHKFGSFGAGTAAMSVNTLKTAIQGVGTAVSNIDGKTATVTVQVNQSGGSVPSGGEGGGTDGWMGNAAFAKGTIGAAKTEMALTGELGPEIRVRGRHWELLGENGPEFNDVRKGDIIFNAEQTEDLLTKGHTNKTGKAFAFGTSGAAYYNTEDPSDRLPTNTSKSKGGNPGNTEHKRSSNGDKSSDTKKESKSLDNLKKKWDKFFDWIAIKLENIQKEIEKATNKAEQTWRIQATREEAYAKAIQNTNTAIRTNSLAEEKYRKQAETVHTQGKKALSKSSDKKDVDDAVATLKAGGKLDISSYSEKAKNVIEEYQKWYDEAEKCKETVEELEASQHDLNTAIFEMKIKRYEDAANSAATQNEKIQAQAELYGKTTKEQYTMMESNNATQIQALKEQRELLRQQQEETTEVDSEEWRELQSQIDQLDISILNTKKDTKDLKIQASEDDIQSFETLADSAERSSSYIQAVAELNDGLTKKQYGKLQNNNNIQIQAYTSEIAELQKAQKTLSKKGTPEWDEYQKRIDDTKEKVVNLQNENKKLKLQSIDDDINKLKSYNESYDRANDKVKQQISLREMLDKTGSTKQYEKMNKNITKQINNYKQQNDKIKEQMELVKKGSQAWLDYKAQIEQNEAAMQSLTQSILENTKAVYENFAAIRDKTISKAQDRRNILDTLYFNTTGKNVEYTQSNLRNKNKMYDIQDAAYDKYYESTVAQANKAKTQAPKDIKKALKSSEAQENEKYKKALLSAQERMKNGKSIKASDLKTIAENDTDLATTLYLYENGKEAIKTARMAQMQNKAETTAGRFENITADYDRQHQVNQNYIDKATAKMQNKDTAKGQNQSLRTINGYIDRNVSVAQNRTAAFAQEKKIASAEVLSFTARGKYKKTIQQAMDCVKKDTAIGVGIIDSIIQGVNEGAILYEFYEACIRWNDAIEWHREAAAQQILEEEAAKKEKRANALQMVQNVAQEGQNKRQANTQRIAERQSLLQMDSAMGYYGQVSRYEEQIGYQSENLVSLQGQLAEQEKLLNENIINGIWHEGDQEYHDAIDRINETRNSIYNTKLEVRNLQNELRALDWQKFDDLMTSISRLNSEMDHYQSLLANWQMFDDDNFGSITEYGMASLDLHNSAIAANIAEAQKYLKEYEEVNAKIASGEYDEYDQAVINRKNELIDKYWDAAEAAENEREAVISLARQGYESQLSYLNKIISKYKDLQEQEKSAYEYQKQIAESTKSITDLQKQLQAYEGNTSEEARTTIQKLRSDLKEAEANKQDIQYDRYISESQRMLDDLANNFQDWIDDYLKDRNDVLADVQSELAGASTKIGQLGTYTEELKNRAGTIQTATEGVKTSVDTAFGEAARNGLTSGLTSGITNGVNGGLNVLGENVMGVNKNTLTDTVNTLLKLDNTMSEELKTALSEDAHNVLSSVNDKLDDGSPIIQSIQSYQSKFDAMIAAQQNLADKALTETDIANAVASQIGGLMSNLNDEKEKEAYEENAKNMRIQAENDARAKELEELLKKAEEEFAHDAETQVNNSAKTEQQISDAKTQTTKNKQAEAKEVNRQRDEINEKILDIKEKQQANTITLKEAKDKLKAEKDALKKLKDDKASQKKIDKQQKKVDKAQKSYNTANDAKKAYASQLKALQDELQKLPTYYTGSPYISKDQLAWTQENGQEVIYRKADGAMLTPLKAGDKVFTAAMTDNLWKIAQMNISDMISSAFAQPVIASNNVTNTISPQTTIEMSITLPNVTNYEQFKSALLADNKFQNGIQAMTLGAAMKQNSLNKFKYN